MMKKTFILLSSFLIISLWSCQKITTSEPQVIDPSLKTTKDLVIPTTFSFETSNEVSVGILVKNAATNLSDVPVSIYLDFPGFPEAPNLDARLIGTFISKSNGRIDVQLKLPVAQDSLYLKTSFIGIESEAGFPIMGSKATYNFGEGNTLKSSAINLASTPQLKANFIYSFMGTYNSEGVPDYCEKTRDVIPQSLLNDINASLPERVRLPVSHPQYLAKGNQGNIVPKEQADVWITFVSEGAGNHNAIGYYTYNVSDPPKTRSSITKHTIIFPNASLTGSGGGLKSGDKVYLGRFNAGVSIGWFLVANGWNGSGVTSQPNHYSDPILNSEPNVDNRQHTILLYDNLRGLLLLGFEDSNRNNLNTSDEDFNDAIFYITANPVKSIDVVNIPSIDTPSDDDKDGVTNSFDEFPKDPARAFTKYYPAKDQYNSLLVEDLWPSMGDYDFNDLVVDCNYKEVTNAQSNVVEMFIKLKVRAIGASYKNGFGIQLPVSASAVSSVTITDQTGAVKNIGVEAGQSKAVVIAFDNAFTLLPSTGGVGVNVVTGNTYREPKDIELHIIFATPQTTANLGTAPFNPFVTVNGDRTKEIHLANANPTDKASAAYFGQGDDTSNPASSRYYKSKKNLIWMMELPSSFAYSIEKNDIIKSYLKFGSWAESGGSLYKDWYMDKSGYRDNSLIYSKQ